MGAAIGWAGCGFICGMAGCRACGIAVGVVAGVSVEGVLRRVCLRCMRGAVLVRWGAVGFVEVGMVVSEGSPFVGCGSPFELGHGSDVTS